MTAKILKINMGETIENDKGQKSVWMSSTSWAVVNDENQIITFGRDLDHIYTTKTEAGRQADKINLETKKVYSQPLEMPHSKQEGLANFVQLIINDIESGNTREALLRAVDLKNDVVDEIYKVQ